MKWLKIAGIVIVIALIFWMNRFEYVNDSGPGVYQINRITGDVTVIYRVSGGVRIHGTRR